MILSIQLSAEGIPISGVTMTLTEADLKLPYKLFHKRFLEPAMACIVNQRPATVPAVIDQYDIATDTSSVVSAEGVIPSTTASGTAMSFNQALLAMKNGAKVRRPDWVAGRCLEFNPKMLPHLSEMPGGTIWAHTPGDMAGRDWMVVA